MEERPKAYKSTDISSMAWQLQRIVDNVHGRQYNIKWIQGCLFESRCNRTLQMYSHEKRETEFWTVMNSRDVNYHILFYAALIPCTSKCNLINKPNK